MNKLYILLFFALIIGIIGCAGRCKTSAKIENTLSGTLYVAGNEPFSYLALDTTDRIVYKIECSDSLKKELWQLQGKTVQLNYNELKNYDKLNIAVVKNYTVIDVETNTERE